MKIECLKESLQKAVTKADRISGKNSNLPVLSTILLSVKGKKFLVKSTNLDLGLEIGVPAKILKEGEVCVSGSILNSYLSNLNTKNISLELNENVLRINSDKGEISLKTINNEDFPIIPKISNEESLNSFSINSEDFINGLKSVWYSASPSSIKPELSSVYIYQSEGKIYFVATDSFRLAEKSIIVTGKNPIQNILIPFRNVANIIKSLELSGLITVTTTKNQISFLVDDLYLTSRIVDGVFPDYKQIIPKSFVTEVILLKGDILNSLHLVNVFTDKFGQVSFSIKTKNKTFEISAKNSDIGEGREKIEASISGGDLDISFNYKYIIDLFQSLHSDSVTLSFSGPQKPLVVRGISDKSFTYLVMPMNR